MYRQLTRIPLENKILLTPLFMSLKVKHLKMIRSLPESAEKCFTTLFEKSPDTFDKYVTAVKEGLKVWMTTFPSYIRTLTPEDQVMSLEIRKLMLGKKEDLEKYMQDVTPEELLTVRRIIFNAHIFGE